MDQLAYFKVNEMEFSWSGPHYFIMINIYKHVHMHANTHMHFIRQSVDDSLSL